MFPEHHTSRAETGDADTEPVTVELYVRSLCSGAERPPQDAAIERLERLERDGVLEEYTVRVWGRRVSPDSAAAETAAGRFVLSRIGEFRNWARRTGASVRSFFDTHEVDSSITDESYTAITVPTLTLAEFHGDDLHRVTPCSLDGAVHTVGDHLDALEATARTDGDGDRRDDGFERETWSPGSLANAPTSGSDGGVR
jgi:DNA-binding Lrp family transcriptional regulator